MPTGGLPDRTELVLLIDVDDTVSHTTRRFARERQYPLHTLPYADQDWTCLVVDQFSVWRRLFFPMLSAALAYATTCAAAASGSGSAAAPPPSADSTKRSPWRVQS